VNSREPLSLKSETSTQPVPRFVVLILKKAIQDEADHVVFELDLDLHKKVKVKEEKMMAEGRIPDSDELPKAFQITFKIGGKEQKLSPSPGGLFEPVVRILLNAAGIPYWTQGETSAELETVNPYSKWVIESKDLTQRIQLRRIRAT
jgi:hypothetical protein